MTRVSGAIDMDLGKLEGRVTAAVVDQISPAFGNLGRMLAEILAAVQVRPAAGGNAAHLNPEDTAQVLWSHLPSGVALGQSVGAFQAQRLAAAGYALVAIGGDALAHAARTHGFKDWPSPVEPVTAIPAHSAEARADARLAEAQADGIDDSWSEDD